MSVEVTSTPVDTIPTFAGGTRTDIPAAPPESDGLRRRITRSPQHFTFEPSSRWVRGVVGDTAIVDSRHQLLVWEPGAKVAEYVFPEEQVRTDLLQPGGPPAEHYYRPGTRDVQWYDLVIGDRRIPSAAWRYQVPGLERFVAVTWFHGVLDGWFEEDEPVIVHPRDPGSRVDAIPSSRHVVVRLGDRVLADSSRPVALFEHGLPTRFYLPREDVRWSELQPVDLVTECPYKGYADSYWAAADAPDRELAWSYSAPKHQVSVIQDRVAFYNERVQLEVDGAPYRDTPRSWA